MQETEEEEKNSHLPCAGIILFRFYGYHLSFSIRPTGIRFSTPGTLENRFSAGDTNISNLKAFRASN
jgi:hypothetical protein